MSQQDEDDLLIELYQAQEDAKKAQLRLENLTVAAQMALEQSGQTTNVVGTLLLKAREAGDVSKLLLAIQRADPDALLDAHGAMSRNQEELERLIGELTLEPIRPVPPVVESPQVSPALVEQAVNRHLEQRLGVVCLQFYQKALELPRCLRDLEAKFSDTRVEFQRLMNKRRKLIDNLLREDIGAKLWVLRSRIERTQDPSARPALVELFEHAIAQTREYDLDIRKTCLEAQTCVENSFRLRSQFCDESSVGQEIGEKVRDVERLVAIFGLPCPPEISRQLQEVRERLQYITSEGQTTRLETMLMFQGLIPDLPATVQNLFEERPSHGAFFLSLQPNPVRLFKDSTTKETAISRLCVLMALLMGEDKGLGQKTIVKMLSLSGLAQEEDYPLFEKILDELTGVMFTKMPFKRAFVLCPTEGCRRAAQETIEASIDPEGLHFALREGKRAFWKERYGGKDATA